MKYKQIPNTDMNVSVISLGTWVFGGDNWGAAGERDCIAAIETAVESGINLIDTAPIYGMGVSEEIIGKAIAGKRGKVLIATKCGLLKQGGRIVNNLKPESIRREIEQSLLRLRTDYIDIYQCHWPDPNTPISETMNELLKIKQQGKIRHIGVSNFDLKLLNECSGVAEIVTMQNQYSLLERSVESRILPHCVEKGIGMLAYGSLSGGVLSGKYSNPTSFNGSDARSFFYKHYNAKGFKEASGILNELNDISKRIQRPAAEIALNWIWQKQGVVSAIVGCRNKEQVLINVSASTWKLSTEDIQRLDLTRKTVLK